MSEAELFVEMAGGSRTAFSALYDRYAPHLFGLAMCIVKNRNLAEEIIQDVFVTLWKKPDRFDQHKGRLGVWISYVCRNRCIDELRNRARNPVNTGIDDHWFARKSQHPGHSPWDRIHHKEIGSTLRRALDLLPQEQKQIVELAYFEGLSQSQISEKLNLPLGTVKTRTRLAMMKLRTSLDHIQNQAGQDHDAGK